MSLSSSKARETSRETCVEFTEVLDTSTNTTLQLLIAETISALQRVPPASRIGAIQTERPEVCNSAASPIASSRSRLEYAMKTSAARVNSALTSRLARIGLANCGQRSILEGQPIVLAHLERLSELERRRNLKDRAKETLAVAVFFDAPD